MKCARGSLQVEKWSTLEELSKIWLSQEWHLRLFVIVVLAFCSECKVKK